MGPSMCLGSASVQNLSFTLVQELRRLLYAPIHLLKILLECHLQWCSVCDPAKVFLTSKFSYLLFSNPAHQTKTGTANRWRLLIATHLDQSNYLANQQQDLDFAVSFTSLSILGQNNFAEPNWHVLNFLHPICRATYWAPVELLLL